MSPWPNWVKFSVRWVVWGTSSCPPEEVKFVRYGTSLTTDIRRMSPSSNCGERKRPLGGPPRRWYVHGGGAGSRLETGRSIKECNSCARMWLNHSIGFESSSSKTRVTRVKFCLQNEVRKNTWYTLPRVAHCVYIKNSISSWKIQFLIVSVKSMFAQNILLLPDLLKPVVCLWNLCIQWKLKVVWCDDATKQYIIVEKGEETAVACSSFKFQVSLIRKQAFRVHEKERRSLQQPQQFSAGDIYIFQSLQGSIDYKSIKSFIRQLEIDLTGACLSVYTCMCLFMSQLSCLQPLQAFFTIMIN